MEPRLSIVEKTLILLESEYFAGLSSEEVARVAARAEEIHYEPGAEVDYSRGLYLVIEGTIDLELHGRAVRALEPGQGLGLAPALGLKEYDVFTARAGEHAHVLFMERDDFLETMSEFPEVAIALLKQMMKVNLQLNYRIEALEKELAARDGGAADEGGTG